MIKKCKLNDIKYLRMDFYKEAQSRSPMRWNGRQSWLQPPYTVYQIIARAGHPIGYIIVDRRKTASKAMCADSYIYVLEVYVLPEERNRGYMTGAIKSLRESYQLPIKLDVENDNPIAIKAYESRGFKKERMRLVYE